MYATAARACLVRVAVPVGVVVVDARGIVGEHHQIVRLPVAIADVVLEQRLAAESERFEHRDRGLLVLPVVDDADRLRGILHSVDLVPGR